MRRDSRAGFNPASLPVNPVNPVNPVEIFVFFFYFIFLRAGFAPLIPPYILYIPYLRSSAFICGQRRGASGSTVVYSAGFASVIPPYIIYNTYKG
jgi:hypothetical protein